MSKFEKTGMKKFPDGLHLAFATAIIGVVNAAEFIKRKLGALCNKLAECVEKEDICYKIVSKSDLSRKKAEKDHDRDTIVSAIRKLIQTALLHFDPLVREAAEKVKIIFDTFDRPISIVNLPYNVETVTIYNLIQELLTKYAVEVELLGLTPWLTELKIRNDAFANLAVDYNVEQSEKTPLRSTIVRKETDEAYYNIIEAVDGLIQLEGIDEYTPFVAKVNDLIKQYNAEYAQHLGRIHARKEAEKKAKDEAEKQAGEGNGNEL